MKKISKIVIALVLFLSVIPFNMVEAAPDPFDDVFAYVGSINNRVPVNINNLNYEISDEKVNNKLDEGNPKTNYANNGISVNIIDFDPDGTHDYNIVFNVDDNMTAGDYTYTFMLKNNNQNPATINYFKGNIYIRNNYNVFGTKTNPFLVNVGIQYTYPFTDVQNISINQDSLFVANVNDEETNLSSYNYLSFDPYENEIGVFANNNCPAGDYLVSFKDDDGNRYSGYVKVQTCYMDYGTKKVIVGFGNSDEARNIHIYTGGGSQIDQLHTGFGFYVSAAYVDDDYQVTSAVEQDFMDHIVSCEFDYDDDYISFEYLFTETFKDAQSNDVGFRFYDCSYIAEIDGTRNVKNIEGRFGFDNNDDGEADIYLNFVYVVSTVQLVPVQINVNSLDAINNALASSNALKQVIADKLSIDKDTINFDDGNYSYEIYFNLASGEYTGTITSDVDGANVRAFILAGNTSFEYEDEAYADCWDSDYIRKYKDLATVTLNGGIVNKGGIGGVRGIDFISTSQTDDIGIYINDTSDGESIADIDYVFECSFTGYDYAIKSVGNSMVSGIKYCLFTNNDTAIHIDSTNLKCDSSSMFNTFVNNGCAINLVKLPDDTNSYQYVLRSNYIYDSTGNGVDYKLSDNLQGVFFFTNNYYGTTYSTGMTNNNNRNSVVVQGANSEAVTGPLIKYPESSSILAFDASPTGGKNKFFNGTAYTVHIEELDIKDITIGVFDPELEQDSGALIFGGNE